jgi:hypothetical protein
MQTFLMKLQLNNILLFAGSFIVLGGCGGNSSSSAIQEEIADIVELNVYDTIVAYEDNVLGVPLLLDFDPVSSHLLIFDLNYSEILEINTEGEIVNRIGRRGSGPGELRGVQNIFLTEDNVFISDHIQYVIHKYERDGSHIDSRLYQDPVTYAPGVIPPPRPPVTYNMNNQPYITGNGHVLLSTAGNDGPIYKLSDWEGNHLADIGELPETNISMMTDVEYKSAIENRQVEPDYNAAFPVTDLASPEEFFLVYSTIPKIEKYNEFGQKLWESYIPETPEVSVVADSFYVYMEEVLLRQPGYRLPMRKYAWGRSSPDGGLFLATYTYFDSIINNVPLWIHQFSSTGELVRRFKLNSDTDLVYFFDIDFEERRIFTLPFERAEVWAYPF